MRRGPLLVARARGRHDPRVSVKGWPMTFHADFTSQNYFRDPGAAIDKLRNQGPLVEVRFPIIGRVWTTTNQALADQVLKDTATFTIRKDDGTVAGFRWWMPGIVRTLANSMLSMDEPDHKRLRAMVFLLLFAGYETTTHLISGSVHELLKNPDLRDWLEEDWSRVDLAVEEFLRFVTPVQFTKPRYVRKDIELGGVRLRKGDRIMVMLAAANMDPQANPHPERLDLQRTPDRHIAFGTGIHFCLGQ